MIAIVDYGMGNVGSVKNAVEAIGREVLVSSKKEDLEKASHIILPGVGAFGDGMKNLRDLGLIEVLRNEIIEKKKLFLGICLGMQVLADVGEEGGINRGFGWIRGKARKFQVDESRFKIPHIGWNDVYPVRTQFTEPGVRSNGVFTREGTKIFAGIKRPIFYFVHSFHLVPEDQRIISAEAEYGEKFAAAIEKDNIFGLQFHPEKSQKEGLKVLENFLTQ